ncbi:MAG: hypothetical protein EOL87_07325 [Spartobacteria bacterium]|nr:hypothetical protein [Spartobacteria bacterium]
MKTEDASSTFEAEIKFETGLTFEGECKIDYEKKRGALYVYDRRIFTIYDRCPETGELMRKGEFMYAVSDVEMCRPGNNHLDFTIKV